MTKQIADFTRKLVMITGALGLMLMILAASLSSANAAQPERDLDQAQTYVTGLINRALPILGKPIAANGGRTPMINELVRGHFAMDKIALFVLGPAARQISGEERAAFTDLFTDYAIGIYTNRLSDIEGDKLAVTYDSARLVGRGGVIVATQFSGVDEVGTSFNNKIEWRLITSDDGYRIVDVIFEGISMAQTLRDEFQSVISQQGVKGLMAIMQDKLAANS